MSPTAPSRALALRQREKQLGKKIALVVLAEKVGAAEACRLLGAPRSSYYRLSAAYERGGIEALRATCRSTELPQNRVGAEIEEAILSLARTRPHLGKGRVAAELRRTGKVVSPSGVASVWSRHDLTTPRKRLVAAGAHGAPPQGDHNLASPRRRRVAAADRDITPLGGRLVAAANANPTHEREESTLRELREEMKVLRSTTMEILAQLDKREPGRKRHRPLVAPTSPKAEPAKPGILSLLFGMPMSPAPERGPARTPRAFKEGVSIFEQLAEEVRAMREESVSGEGQVSDGAPLKSDQEKASKA